MQIVRCLYFVEAFHGFVITTRHIPGCHNNLADALSRNQEDLFLSRETDACPVPTCVPILLLQWILHPNFKWTSRPSSVRSGKLHPSNLKVSNLQFYKICSVI